MSRAHFQEEDLSLLTDLYELTMMQGYFFKKLQDRGTFELFYRRAPYDASFVVLAGAGRALEQLCALRFTPAHIKYLEGLGLFQQRFLDYLKDFRFQGEVRAIAEGTPVFPFEPIAEVSGSLIEAQWVESFLLNSINYESLIATKAARICHAARGKPVLEFGLRRAHGPAGGLFASRAAIIGGCHSTSNTLAGFRYGARVSGTMAHSWVMSFDNEEDSFFAYGDIYPEHSIFLVDTYDTLGAGLPHAIAAAKEVKKKGGHPVGIRLDSGDFYSLSVGARKMLDEAELREMKIFVSGDLDEHIIEELEKKGAPIDAYGVGTRLATGGEQSALGGVYKLTAISRPEFSGEQAEQMQEPSGYSSEGVIKISDDPVKSTLPGKKNILRFYKGGKILADFIVFEQEAKEALQAARDHKEMKGYAGKGFLEPFAIQNYDEAELLLALYVESGSLQHEIPSLEVTAHSARLQYEKALDETGRPRKLPVAISENIYSERKKLLALKKKG